MRRIPRQQAINVYVDNQPKEDSQHNKDSEFICIKSYNKNETIIRLSNVKELFTSGYCESERQYFLEFKIESEKEIQRLTIRKEEYERLKELLLNERGVV